MKCPFCSASEPQQFSLVAGSDNPQAKPKPYAYNLYQCECDAVCKKNIWSHDTEVWISGDNTAIDTTNCLTEVIQ